MSKKPASTFTGRNDWRLPNVKELLSIVERRCAMPAINSEIFPETTTWNYWTSSPNVSGNGNAAHLVGFGQGAGLVDGKSGTSFYNVRLVRTVR